MAEYDWAVDLAEDLIAQFGRDVQIQRVTNIASDPAKPWRTTSATAITQTVRAVAVPAKADRPEGVKRSRDDREYIIAYKSLTTDIHIDDILIDNGRWAIQNEVHVSPGSQDIIVSVLARKWPPRSNS